MEPKIGDSILLKGLMVNGHDEHPGVITNVYHQNEGGFAVINATVFVDTNPTPQCYGSINYASSREEAEKYIATFKGLICIPR